MDSKKMVLVIVAFVVTVMIVGMLTYLGNSNDNGTPVTTATPIVVTDPSSATNASDIYQTTAFTDISSITTDPSSSQTTVPVPTTATQTPNTTATPVAVSPASWSKAEIVSRLTAAITKTKAYSGAVSVGHKESFTANITKCTGGSLGAKAANWLVESVVKPTDETLNFNGGKCVNSEGETVQLLLPKTSAFTLSADGVKSASATAEGDGYSVNLTLIEEDCGLTDVPKHNASSVGYLNVASLDMSFMTITSAQINYTGTTIAAHVNASGYVTSVTYTVPLHVEGAAKAMGITGEAVFDGQQQEIWTIRW